MHFNSLYAFINVLLFSCSQTKLCKFWLTILHDNVAGISKSRDLSEVINIIETPISVSFPDQPPDILELSTFYFVPRSATKNLSKRWRLGQFGTHKLVPGDVTIHISIILSPNTNKSLFRFF